MDIKNANDAIYNAPHDTRNFQEIAKVSEGVFSSDGGNSPLIRELKPQYTPFGTRPQT